MRKISGVHVYTAKIPDVKSIINVLPKEKNIEIESINNEKVKAQKFYAWKLLEFAILNSFGYLMDELKFTKSENGKWLCDKFYFSISHSDNLVAVSLSNVPVGIDVEKFERPKKDVTRIFSENERLIFDKLNDEQKWQYLITSWVKKESIYKMKGNGAFLPSKIDTTNSNTVVDKMELNGKTYVFSVVADTDISVQFFNNVKL